MGAGYAKPAVNVSACGRGWGGRRKGAVGDVVDANFKAKIPVVACTPGRNRQPRERHQDCVQSNRVGGDASRDPPPKAMWTIADDHLPAPFKTMTFIAQSGVVGAWLT